MSTSDNARCGTPLADVAECCRILGALFYLAPDRPELAPVLDGLADGALAAAWPLGAPGAVAAITRRMGAAIEPQALRAEFQRLFVGPDHLAAPPWGSAWLDQEGLLYGETTTALAEFLDAQGLRVATGQVEPEDHIGLVFWAAAWLADEARTQALRTLLDAHLRPWAGRYLQALAQAAASPFYRGAAELAGLTLEELHVCCGKCHAAAPASACAGGAG